MKTNRTLRDIPRPQLKSARELTAAELNKIRLSEKHTLLTPDRLARMAASAGGTGGEGEKSEESVV